MRFSIPATIAVFGSAALAQNVFDQIPQCARACFGSNLGTCGQTDVGCICGNTAVIDKISCCVFASCSQEEIAATTQFAAQLCKIQNIDINTVPSCPSGSAISSATSPGNGTASATGPTSSASSTTSASESAAASMGNAPLKTTGAGLGLGMALVGFIAAL